MIRFSQVNDLRVWLAEHVDLSTWGIGAAKSVDDLWSELETGESTLADSPFQRNLTGVVQLIILNRGRILIETRQSLIDGRIRE